MIQKYIRGYKTAKEYDDIKYKLKLEELREYFKPMENIVFTNS